MTMTAGQDEQSRSSGDHRLSTWLRTRKRRLLVAAVVTGVLASLVTGGLVWWHRWTHPDVLPDQGYGLRLAPRSVGRATVSWPATWADTGAARVLTFRSVHATFTTNTAHAGVTFEICEHRPGRVLILGIYHLDRECASLTPLAPGTTMTYPSHDASGPPRQYIVATIMPTTPGEVHLAGLTFTYSLSGHHLAHTTTDSVATDVTIPVR
jgi:hypothetical protein